MDEWWREFSRHRATAAAFSMIDDDRCVACARAVCHSMLSSIDEQL